MDGQPVGSRTLSKEAGLDLSPATIRNVMADLEGLGLIASPHTSAGRVPTDKGIRLFVDSMIRFKDPKPQLIETISEQFNSANNSKQLIATASCALSELTNMAGVVTVPKRASHEISRIEFLKLSGSQVLAITVTNNHEVENRVLNLSREFSHAELEKVAASLNQYFVGKKVTTVRKSVLADMRATRESMNKMMQEAVTLAEEMFSEKEDAEKLVMAGQVNLMEFAELSNVAKLRNLFEAFNEQRDILHILDQCVTAEGVRIYIGEESGYKVFDGMSLVTSTYSLDDEVVGVLGVIGPTRMSYSKVVPIVDLTSKLLGKALDNS